MSFAHLYPDGSTVIVTMVNPGAFSGSRKEFLTSLKAYYAAAVNEGNAAEAISTIQRRYFIRYPVEMPHDVEPSDEHLAAVDDDAAVPEVEGPNPDVLSLEEYETELSKWEDRQKLIMFRKAQIKRWFAYQFMKDTDLDSTQTGLFNPYRPLLTKLTGKKINAPRQRSAANVWRKTQREVIEAEVQLRLAALEEENNGEKMKKENLIAFRDNVARELFKRLTDEEQRSWQLAAITEHNAATREWKVEMEGKPKKDPQSRQVAIQGLVKFVQPILDLICDATGWKASLICGGPEPAQSGLLNIVSIHSGATSGDVKMSFGRTEREQFRKVVVPLYGSFLQKCYTPVECRSRALGADQGFLPLADLDLDNEGASVDPVSPPSAHPPPIRLGPTHTDTQSAPKPTKKSKTSAKPAPAHVHAAPPHPPAPAHAHAAPPHPPAPAHTHAAPPPAIMQSTAIQPPLDSSSRPSITPSTEMHPLSSQFSVSVPQPPPLPRVHPVASSKVQVEQAAAGNPFPFEIPGSDSPRPMPLYSTRNTSQPPTPQPSPCPSPPPPSPPQTPGTLLPDSRAQIQPDEALSATTAVSEEDSEPLSSMTMATEGSPEKDGVESQNEGVRLRRSNRGLKTSGKPKEKAKSIGKGGTKRRLDDSQASSSTAAADQRTKRQRTTTQPTNAFTPPENSPKWFKNAFKMLSSADLGEEWKGMVARWGRFELEAGFNGDSRLRTEGRPGAIGDWIQRARSSTWRPPIGIPTAFGLEVQGWWQRLQPKWRVGEDGTLAKDLDGDWEELRKPGVNGLLGVGAALLYWGEALKKSKTSNQEWLEVVLDFQLVLSKLS